MSKTSIEELKKFNIKDHDRSYFQPKRLMNWVLHFIILFTFYSTSTGLFKIIHIDHAISSYYFLTFITPHTLMLLAFVNIFYGFLYYNKFPAIEKNKSNGLPWPWEENSKKFWDHFPTVIWTYLSN